MSVLLAQLLATPPLAGLRPKLLAGGPDARVRAVHDALDDAEQGDLVVLGDRDAAPVALRRLAEERGIALVAARGDAATLAASATVAFATAQAARLSELEGFTSRLLDELRAGRGLSGLLEVASVAVDAPVVLVSTERRIVATAGVPADVEPATVLAGPTVSLPLAVAGSPWGGLSTAATHRPGPASSLELMQRLAGVAEVELLRSSEALAPEPRARRELLIDLLAGRGAGLAQRTDVLGLHVAPADELLTLAVDRTSIPRGAVERALQDHGVAALWSRLDEDVLVLGLAPRGRTAAGAADRIAAALAAASGDAAPRRTVVAVGPVAVGLGEAGRALREARRTLAIARAAADERPVVTAAMLLVDRLLARFAGDADVAHAVGEVLAPFDALPAGRAETLRDTLQVYLDTGASKTGAARRLGIRRQSLYTRLEQLDALVGPLADPERRLALQLALRAARLLSAGTGA